MMNKLNLLIIYSTLIFQINGQFIGNESNETTPDTTSIETSTITILTTTETPIITTTTTTRKTLNKIKRNELNLFLSGNLCG